MRVVQVLLTAVNVGAALSLKTFPYKVREVTHVSKGESPESRIYGGTLASEGQFPYMIFALMRVGWKKSQCSASLISPKWVLLAAHCVYFEHLKPNDIIVVGGKADLREYVSFRIINFDVPIDGEIFGVQERRTKKYYYHPKYDPETLEHDTALIEVKAAFVLGPVSLIALSEKKMKSPKMCTILGWGLTPEGGQTFRLNYVSKKMVRTTELGCEYKKWGPFICLAHDNSGICQGDSGSPLVCENAVWGVASHLVSNSDNPGCSESLEEYYSELYEDLDWVNSVYDSNNAGAVAGVRGVWMLALASVVTLSLVM